jgi:hypothetical protein
MKRPILIGFTVATLFAVILILHTIQHDSVQSIEAQIPHHQSAKQASQINSSAHSKAANLLTLDPLLQMEMKKVKYVPDYVGLARSIENPLFRCLGGSGTGRVVDREGRVVMDSGKEIGILGVAVGPDGKHVLIEGGDAINYVLSPSTGEKIQLPVYPPGTNMLGFGTWNWINETKLLGVSGVQSLDEKGVPVQEDNNVAQTKLYVYDLTTQSLAEVPLPSEVSHLVVNIAEVSPDGHVHLMDEAPHRATEQDLGWFEINSPSLRQNKK